MLLDAVLVAHWQTITLSAAGDNPVWAPFSRPDVVQLVLMCVSGAFGGIVYAIASLLNAGIESEGGFRGKWKAAKGGAASIYLFGQCIIGIGGACAAVFGLVTLGKAATNASNTTFLQQDHLYFITLCVVGGFIANSLLTAVGEKLLKQIAETKEDIDKLKKEHAETQSKLKTTEGEVTSLTEKNTELRGQLKAEQEKNERKFGVLEQSNEDLRTQPTDIATAREVYKNLVKLNGELKKIRSENKDGKLDEAIRQKEEELAAPTTRARDYIQRLEEYAKRYPLDRPTGIALANLYDGVGEQQTAIEVLKRFIQARKASGSELNDDVASAWFNIACEHVALMNKAPSNEAKDAQKREAIAALKQTLEISRDAGALSHNVQKTQTETDPELDPIRRDPEFIALAREFGIDPTKRVG